MVYLAARAVSAVVLVTVARTQAANLWTGAAPSYADWTGLMWDASWYSQIAEQGYPAELPLGTDGAVVQNAWAFFPLFPALARAGMAVTGLEWRIVAPTLALLAGIAGALVVHRVMATVVAQHPRAVPTRSARWLPLATVAVLATAPSAPVLQVAYTESLALLLLATALWCLLERWYGWAIPVVLALGLTRAVALPFAAVVVAHGLVRLRDRDDDFPVRERIAVVGLAGVAAVAGVLWPIIVGLRTGEPDAYTRTQAAWRGRRAVVPVLPWFDVARWLGGGGWLLLLGAVLVLGVLAVAVTRPFGVELTTWTGGYLLYLLGAIEPGTSLARFLLLAFPVAAGVAGLALRARHRLLGLAVLVVLGVAGQIAWVALIWRLVPPSGWPP